MYIFTEDQYDDLARLPDSLQRKYEAAKHMASLGIQIFPARAYDGEAFDAAYAEYVAENEAAKAEKRKPTIPQKHFKQHGGKAPAEGLGDQYKVASNVLAQIEKWWHPTKGKYRGNNICVSTGKASGLIVVDLDVKPEEGVDGFAWWNDLVDLNGDVDTFRVRSGGQSTGGQHLYFRFREGVETRNGLANGVDIRVERSHVVAPFSECQGTYEAITFDEVAEIPDWLYDALTARGKQAPKKDGKPKPDFDDSDEQQAPAFGVTPIDQIEEMLEYLDPCDPDIDQKWKSIMYAVHSEHPTDEGLRAIQNWSRRNEERFDEADNADMWKRANEAKASGATIGTLYHLAEEHGWVNPKKGAIYVDVSRAVRMMNRSFAVIDPDRYALDLMRRGKRFDPSKLPACYYPPMTMFKTKVVLTDSPEQHVHTYSKVAEVNPDQIAKMAVGFKVLQELPGNKVKVSSLQEVWMPSQARKSYASAGYYVVDKEVPPGVLNLFPGWQVQPKEGHPTKFVEHITNIIGKGDPERAYWIFNRLAYMVQFGDKVMPTSLVITGAQGAGKSIIGDYLKAMMGILNYKYLHDSEALKSRFSEELVGKFLIIADEAIFAGDPGMRNKLKSMIAAEVLRDEGKGKAAKDAQNVMFLIVFSNEDEPVGIESGDRRFTVMAPDDKYSYAKTKEDPELHREATRYFNELVKEMKGDGPANLLHMLLNWEVDKTVARTALVTQEKKVMEEGRTMKTDSLTAFIYSLYTLGYGDDTEIGDPNDTGERWGGRVRTGTLYEQYAEWAKNQKAHHRNSEWKAEPLNVFTKRLVEEFECQIVKPKGKSTVCWPEESVIREILVRIMPETMKMDAAASETDF
ncbi:DNA polymerase/primase [Burkholderia phage Bm1]